MPSTGVDLVATNLLEIVTDALPELSKSERRVASFLLENPQALVSTSVKELATKLEVSEPTIIRFCRTIGCDGYRDLKIQLAQDLAVKQAFMDATRSPARHKRRAASKPTTEDFAGAVFDGAQSSIAEAETSLDRALLAIAATILANANNVTIYGVGGSSAILAAEMHNRLFRLGIHCVAYIDSYVQRMSSATMREGDVAFFVSSTGRPRSLQDSAELARYYGAKCIGITPSDSPLARELDVCIDLELTQAGVSQLQPNPMRYAQLYIIDCLAFATGELMGQDALDALDRGRASVASLHGIAPQQPIGD